MPYLMPIVYLSITCFSDGTMWKIHGKPLGTPTDATWKCRAINIPGLGRPFTNGEWELVDKNSSLLFPPVDNPNGYN